MATILGDTQLEAYRSNGFYFPLRVLSNEEAAQYRSKLEEFETEQGKPLQVIYRQKAHLLFTWLDDLIRDKRILDIVEDVLGPNLFCWTSNFFIKERHDPSYVSWHQDSTYWGLSEPDVMTVWVAFTTNSATSGCMKVVPGSHLRDQVPHRDTFAEGNLLTRGQEIAVDVDESEAVMMPLEPGEVSLHHVRLFHSSPPNRSDDRRIGFAIRYIPTYVRQIAGEKDSATLVRGVDDFGHFEHEHRPRADFDADAVAQHAQISEHHAAVLYRGTNVSGFRA